MYSGGQVGTNTEDESTAFSNQRDDLEKECAELDRLIRDFSAYLENTVDSYEESYL